MRVIEYRLRATLLVTQRLLWFILALALVGCAGGADPGPLFTPVTQATLDAFQYGQPIARADQAVVAARLALGTTRIHFAAPPWPISVESMTYAEARQRLERPGHARHPDSMAVWLVIFEGDYQIVGPMEQPTPGAEGRRCAYALIRDRDGGSLQMGTIDCDVQR
jgi:hypothetical protein